MSTHFQVRGRVPAFRRFACAGRHALRLSKAFRATGIWDASLGITLNGTDVSALAHQPGPRPWLATGPLDLTQPSGANQPLYTGAPTYGMQPNPSIQYSDATGDELYRTNTNVTNTHDNTLLSVQKLTGTADPQGGVLCNEPVSTAAGIGLAIASGATSRAWHDAATAFRGDGVPSLVAPPEVWIGRRRVGVDMPVLLVDGVNQPLAGGPQPQTDPGAAADLIIGSFFHGTVHHISMDWLFAAWWQQYMPDTVAARLTAALRARYDDGVWTPARLPNMRLWLRASSGLTDISGNGASVVLGASPPLISIDAGYNAKYVMNFAGSKFLTVGALGALAKPYTVLAIGNGPGGAAFHVLFDGFSVTNQFGQNASDQAYMNLGAVLSSVTTITTKQSISLVANGVTSTILVGSLGASRVTGNGGATAADTSFYVGKDMAASAFFNGKLAEIVVLNGVISAADEALFHTYANSQYATPLAA
jgi:hypothetical protein